MKRFKKGFEMNILFEMYPTIITPFTDENRIDYDSLGKLIGSYARCGVDGIFAVCQSELAAFCIEKWKELDIRCVVSGHTQEELADQIAYLRRLEQLGPDAIILVNNRFAKEKEPEEICIANFHRIIKALRPDTILGVYECPYPYKRLISDALLDEMVAAVARARDDLKK